MFIDCISVAKRQVLQRTVWILLVSASAAYAVLVEASDHISPTSTRGPISCAISPLKQLTVLDVKGFEVRKEPLAGHSSEGGTLTILSRKATPQRARAELFGETGKVSIDMAYVGGDLMVAVRWTEYAESLPKMPVRTKKIDTQNGFICSGVAILDRQGSEEIGPDKIAEFEKLTTWLLAELKSRGVAWSGGRPKVPGLK